MKWLLILILTVSAQAQVLRGNVRSLATDSHTILAGTSDGKIYGSRDGVSWEPLASFPKYVVDRVVFSDNVAYAALWTPYDMATGYLLQSRDSGKTWSVILSKKPIRSLAVSTSEIVAGTLSGVFLSVDKGASWSKIGDFDQLDTVTIDPDNPATIYVGTWHLAYKTTDSGTHWHRIDRGMANDSDVFSILVNRSTVYASACSGIYKSQNGGEQFSRVYGIPASAERTRVLRWSDTNTVYAGTTDGLWRTINGGKNWSRATRDGIVVNDILLTPHGFLLATEDGIIKEWD